MSVSMRSFLQRRRSRAVASILGYAEKTFWPQLTSEEREEFRRVVLAALDSYHDSMLDLFRSDDSVRNEEAIEILDAQADQ